MLVASVKQMKEIDRLTIEEYGIPSLVLMENAGRGVANHIISRSKMAFSVAIVCGTGNNGGDGMVAARHLHNAGCLVTVIICGSEDRFTPDAQVQYEIIKKMGINNLFYDDEGTAAARLCIAESDIIVDALFGTGLDRTIEGVFAEVIGSMNHSESPIVSIDIPSGLHGDEGTVLGVAIEARATVTLAMPKLGLFCGEGPQHVGEIECVDISIPRVIIDRVKGEMHE